MFEWITGVIERLGHFGVALLMLLENVFPPIPSELIIPLAGFVAATGPLSVPMVIAMGSLGSLAGATLWYAVGKRVGEKKLRAWVKRYGKWITLGTSDIDRAKDGFKRHGPVAVLVGRLIPGVRTFISLPAGFVAMPLVPFLLYSTIGTVIWTAALTYAGVMLQSNFTLVSDYIGIATNVLLAAFVILMVRRYIRCWRAA